MIEHLPECKPEHMTAPDWEGVRDCLSCGLWEYAPDSNECGSCGAALAPQADGFPYHLPDEDCRAIRHV